MRSPLPHLLLGVLVLLPGCGGGESDYENRPRPASPINITARIADEDIAISPKEFGAGPISLIISNQTAEPQRVTFETDELGGDQPGLAPQTVGPIRPRGTATIKVDVREGTYSLTADGSEKPARIEVGTPRPSAQNELLQP